MVRVVLGFLLSLGLGTMAMAKGLVIDDILSMANRESPDVKLAKQTYEVGRYEARTFLAMALPRIDFNYQFSRADQLLSPTSGGSSDSGVNRFELDNYTWNVQLTSPLYTFGRVGALYSMYSLQTDKVEIEKDYNNDLALLRVIQSYVEALSALKNRQVRLKAQESAKKTVAFTELEFRGGALKETDYLLSEARYEVAQAELIKASHDAADKLTQLKIDIGVPAGQDLNLELINMNRGKYFDLPDYDKRKKSKRLELAEISRDFAAENQTYRGAEYYPSLSIFAQTSGASYKVIDPITTDGGFSDSFKNDNRSSAYGVQLTWNLLAGGGDYANHQMAIAQATQARIQHERNLREEPLLQKGARDNLIASQKVYNAAKRALRARRLAFATDESEFRNGVIPLAEFIQREEQLLEEEKAEIDALGALILSIAQYRINNGWEIR